jgi:hypothetical protein
MTSISCEGNCTLSSTWRPPRVSSRPGDQVNAVKCVSDRRHDARYGLSGLRRAAAGAGEGSYQARLINSPAGQAQPVVFTVPFSALELENFLLRTARARLRCAASTRRILQPSRPSAAASTARCSTTSCCQVSSAALREAAARRLGCGSDCVCRTLRVGRSAVGIPLRPVAQPVPCPDPPNPAGAVSGTA